MDQLRHQTLLTQPQLSPHMTHSRLRQHWECTLRQTFISITILFIQADELQTSTFQMQHLGYSQHLARHHDKGTDNVSPDIPAL